MNAMCARRAAGITAIVAAALTGVPAVYGQPAIEMKIGIPTINDPQHDVANRWAKEVQERTKGQIRAQVYPAMQLGPVARQIESLQLAVQQAMAVPPGFLVGLDPAYQVPDAPGVLQSFEHAHRTFTSPVFRDKYLALSESKGILGLGIWVYDATDFVMRAPVKSLEDFKGKKIRVLASKLESALIGEIGGTGVPMPYGEVLPALQQGAIDGVRSTIIAMETAKFYNGAKYAVLNAGSFLPSVLLVSKAWYTKLTTEQQHAVTESARGLQDWATQNAKVHRERAIKNWSANGGETGDLPPKDRARFVESIRPLGAKILTSEPKTKSLYDAFMTAADKSRP